MSQAQLHAFVDGGTVERTARATKRGTVTKSAVKATKTYIVNVELLDGEVYLATSEDIDGLILETDTLEEMEKEMLENIPWLLEGNHKIRVAKRNLTIAPKGKTTKRKATYIVSHPAA